MSASTGPVVVKVSGSAVDGAGAGHAVWSFIAGLAAAPGGVVVVHGGGAAVDRHAARLGRTPAKVDGLRITPADEIEDVVAVLAGVVSGRVVARIQGAGVPAAGLTLACGGLATAERITDAPVDLGRVGRITGGDGLVLSALLGAGIVPAIASIAADSAGAPLNVNADDAAAGVAMIVGARRLLLLSDVPGVLGPDGAVIAEVASGSIDELVASGTASGGMTAKLRALGAFAGGTGIPVTIASWSDGDQLARLAAGQPAGTSVTGQAVGGAAS